jgi:hypothetical protein
MTIALDFAFLLSACFQVGHFITLPQSVYRSAVINHLGPKED